MPVDGKKIMAALEQLQAPATPEQIADQLASTSRKPYRMLLNEVNEALVGGACFGYIESCNGFFYNLQHTKSLYEDILKKETLMNLPFKKCKAGCTKCITCNKCAVCQQDMPMIAAKKSSKTQKRDCSGVAANRTKTKSQRKHAKGTMIKKRNTKKLAVKSQGHKSLHKTLPKTKEAIQDPFCTCTCSQSLLTTDVKYDIFMQQPIDTNPKDLKNVSSITDDADCEDDNREELVITRTIATQTNRVQTKANLRTEESKREQSIQLQSLSSPNVSDEKLVDERSRLK